MKTKIKLNNTDSWVVLSIYSLRLRTSLNLSYKIALCYKNYKNSTHASRKPMKAIIRIISDPKLIRSTSIRSSSISSEI